MGTCPNCDENLEIDEDNECGQVLQCPKCGKRLEILDLFPVTLDVEDEG